MRFVVLLGFGLVRFDFFRYKKWSYLQQMHRASLYPLSIFIFSLLDGVGVEVAELSEIWDLRRRWKWNPAGSSAQHFYFILFTLQETKPKPLKGKKSRKRNWLSWVGVVKMRKLTGPVWFFYIPELEFGWSGGVGLSGERNFPPLCIHRGEKIYGGAGEQVKYYN